MIREVEIRGTNHGRGLFYVGQETLKRGDWVCVYPAFCIKKNIYDSIFTKDYEDTHPFWPSYAITITIKKDKSSVGIEYVGLPASWYEENITTLNQLKDQLNDQTLAENDTMTYEGGGFDEFYANGHFANEPDGSEYPNIVIEGYFVESDLYGNDFIPSVFVPVVATKEIKQNEQLFLCYGRDYLRHYDEPKGCKKLRRQRQREAEDLIEIDVDSSNAKLRRQRRREAEDLIEIDVDSKNAKLRRNREIIDIDAENTRNFDFINLTARLGEWYMN